MENKSPNVKERRGKHYNRIQIQRIRSLRLVMEVVVVTEGDSIPHPDAFEDCSSHLELVSSCHPFQALCSLVLAHNLQQIVASVGMGRCNTPCHLFRKPSYRVDQVEQHSVAV